MTDLLQGEKKKPFGVPPAFLYGSFLLPLPCPAIAFGDGGTPSSFSKPFYYMLCSQYGEVTLTCVFLQELTPPGVPPAFLLR